jgi:hypothetical protein
MENTCSVKGGVAPSESEQASFACPLAHPTHPHTPTPTPSGTAKALHRGQHVADGMRKSNQRRRFRRGRMEMERVWGFEIYHHHRDEPRHRLETELAVPESPYPFLQLQHYTALHCTYTHTHTHTHAFLGMGFTPPVCRNVTYNRVFGLLAATRRFSPCRLHTECIPLTPHLHLSICLIFYPDTDMEPPPPPFSLICLCTMCFVSSL